MGKKKVLVEMSEPEYQQLVKRKGKSTWLEVIKRGLDVPTGNFPWKEVEELIEERFEKFVREHR